MISITDPLKKNKLKTLAFHLLILFSIIRLNAQPPSSFEIDFSPHQIPYLQTDTSQPDNIWEVGTSLKPVFSNTYGLITDIEYTYPVGNTSSVILTLPYQTGHINNTIYKMWVELFYQIDTDSVLDYGTIEYSGDGGNTWYNLIKDTAELSCQWYTNSGDYSGVSSDSIVFTGTNVNWPGIGFEWTNHLNYYSSDSLKLKFTFHSDSIETNQAGWLIHYIYIAIDAFYWSSVGENSTIKIPVYPNPTTGTAFVEVPTGANYPLTLLAHDYTGREILRQSVNAPGTVQLDIPAQTKGIYIVTLNDASGQVVNRAKLVLIR